MHWIEKWDLTPLQRTNLSGHLRENEGWIKGSDKEHLESLKTPSVNEKATKLIQYLIRLYPSPGERFQLRWILPPPATPDFAQIRSDHLNLLSIAWAKDQSELDYLINRYLVTETKYLDHIQGITFQLSPRGWQYLSSLEARAPLNDTAFVAMCFADDLKEKLWALGLKPGIEAAGYHAHRVDSKEHNNQITDEIVAQLRRCKFVVADFTRNSWGVYFEAGFALGLNKSVVWVCERAQIEKKEIHFDTRQYNFVLWTEGEWGKLQSDLRNRIEATLGHGTARFEQS